MPEITEEQRERLRNVLRERERATGRLLTDAQREAVIDGFFERLNEDWKKH